MQYLKKRLARLKRMRKMLTDYTDKLQVQSKESPQKG